MKRTLYVCRCGNIEHILCVTADEEDLFIEVHLSPHPFWQRVKHAIGYIFGRRSPYGDFDEILLTPFHAFILGDSLVEWSGLGTVDFKNNDVY
jgi:hypothetical protein